MAPASSVLFTHMRDGGDPSLMACLSWSCREINISSHACKMIDTTATLLFQVLCASVSLFNKLQLYKKVTKVCLSTRVYVLTRFHCFYRPSIPTSLEYD